MNVHFPRVGVAIGFLALAAVTAVVLGAPSGAASAPPNDGIADAQPIASLPAALDGTTEGANLSEDEPLPSCARVVGIVWYSVKAPHRGPMAARLRAEGDLDAALVVYRVVRSQQRESVCAPTNQQGRAAVSWYAYAEGSYLIGVARREGSTAGAFNLRVDVAERPELPPGRLLPGGGERATITPVLDPADAWAVEMERGVPYRINVTTASGCVALDIYRPDTTSLGRDEPVRSEQCSGYVVFTPGIDGGGVYSLVVRAIGSRPVEHSYRIQVAAYGPDDGAPGIKPENGEWTSGRLFGRGVDVVDLYRFGIAHDNQLTRIELRVKPSVGFDLVLLTEAGDRLACLCEGSGTQVLRQGLPPGSYFAAVRSRDKSGGRYRLQVLTVDVTTTSISSAGSRAIEVPPGATVPFTVEVTSATVGGLVELSIDHRDPLFGWQFSSVTTTEIGSSGYFTSMWTAPSPGFWRARARYLGTPFSSFSESGYVQVHVAEPLE